MNAIRPRVLVIDYQEESLIALEHLLEGNGFETTTAWSALDGVNATRHQQFDVVLLNEYLPGLDVENLIAELRESAVNVPCILLSATSSPVRRCAEMLASGSDCVCKRAPDDILKTIRKHVAQRCRVTADSGDQHGQS